MSAVEFEPATESAWRALVDKGLAGASFERALVATTAEGLAIEPLYLARHVDSMAGGAPRVPVREGAWRIGQRYTSALLAADPGLVARDRAAGVEAAWIEGGADLAALVAPLGGAGVRCLLDAGASAPFVARAAAHAGFHGVDALFDPFAAMACSELDAAGRAHLLADAAALAKEAPSDALPLAVNASFVHEAGGHAALELGYALAALTGLVRSLEEAGLAADAIASRVGFVVAAGPDQFLAIAKLRALRLAVAKTLAALSLPPARPHVVGLVSRRAQALVDLPTNHLRATNEAFALAVGGADTIVGRAFDELAPTPSALGRRVARTTQLILRDESHLGAVSDPAAGSYFLDTLTDQLARAAWAELHRIEHEGGIEASLANGAFGARVDQSRSTLSTEVAKRKRTLVGVSDFALSGEAIGASRGEPADAAARAEGPFAPMRAAEPFEALRRRAEALAASGRPPRALLACVGLPGDFRAREGFARRLFEAGGFAVSAASGPPDDPSWAQDAITREGAGVLVLCSSDDVYAAHAVTLARALAPHALVVLAGKPGAIAAELDAAGLAAAVHLGADVVATLAALLAKLEAVS